MLQSILLSFGLCLLQQFQWSCNVVQKTDVAHCNAVLWKSRVFCYLIGCVALSLCKHTLPERRKPLYKVRRVHEENHLHSGTFIDDPYLYEYLPLYSTFLGHSLQVVQKLSWTQDTLLRWISILCKVWYVFQLLVPHYFDTYILRLLPWPPNHLIFLSIKSRVPRCNRGFRSFFFWDSDALHILCSLSLCSRALLECSKYLIGKGRRLLVLTVVKHTYMKDLCIRTPKCSNEIRNFWLL